MASPSHTPGESALVDLVCGPASPLPETYQRYRLVARLGSGGQADVYRGVRICGGVTSAPITVKVFRLDPHRPLADELRSWDKGDAALMDLNNRGVSGICRRADGFYGPPPHASGVAPNIRDAVPYQIYDYLHGINLREYIGNRAGLTGGPRLSAHAALHQLADTVKALHHPAEPGACPVLHMDIKPSNIMALTNGSVRLIDFTGARYWRHEEITQIAYTPESGGPEALRGEVSPSYDVHGFGSVVFFMLTGAPPRGQSAPPMAAHPVFDGRPALRDHLLAALADSPADRPSTMELSTWVDRLMILVRSTGVPDLGLDWSEPQPAVPPVEVGRAVGRARPVLAGTETDAFTRIEALERELVALRANSPTEPQLEREALLPPPVPEPVSSPPQAGGRGNGNGNGRQMLVGRAQVVPRAHSDADATGAYGSGTAPSGGARVSKPAGERLRDLKKGGSWTIAGLSFAVLCWIVWAASNRARGVYAAPAVFLGTLVVALGLFVVLRLLGRLVIEGWMHRTRRSAVGAHLGVAAFLFAVGVTYLQQTTWITDVIDWFKGLS